MEIQIVYNNRSMWDASANGKWYDVRLMHSESRRAGAGEPDNPVMANQRCKLGYCCGKHCYDKDAIPEGSDGRGTM